VALVGLLYVVWGVLAPAVAIGVTGANAPSVRFELPIEYLVLAPLTRILDELTLLDERQHIAIAWTLAAIVVAVAGRTALRTPCWRARGRATVRAALVAFGTGLGVYVVGALVPRPMAALVADDPSLVLVDFHSHTDRSHDGRWRFDAESNRAWHSAAGFHAAYVTDHQTMQAWQLLASTGELASTRATLREASIVGGTPRAVTTTLLPGIESVVPGAHLNLLGVSSAHLPVFSHRRNLDTVQLAAVRGAERPLALLTLPFDLGRSVQRAPRIDAIELTNGAPKGLRFSREHRTRILHLADSLQVPLVASSNHHGWGSTAVAWTAMHIPNWQRLQPFALDSAIRRTLGTRGDQVSVIERAGLPVATSGIGHLLTLPRLAWYSARMATAPERLVSVAWMLALLSLRRRRNRQV
jgi:hypothetical protein